MTVSDPDPTYQVIMDLYPTYQTFRIQIRILIGISCGSKRIRIRDALLSTKNIQLFIYWRIKKKLREIRGLWLKDYSCLVW